VINNQHRKLIIRKIIINIDKINRRESITYSIISICANIPEFSSCTKKYGKTAIPSCSTEILFKHTPKFTISAIQKNKNTLFL